ncbi:ATP-binding cassette domain-containing protein [Undibacterium arcticum]
MNAANSTTIFQARGLVKRYGHVTALDGVDFDLRAGEILAVIGDNGAGKSSLIKALSGALVPDEGEMFFWMESRCISTHRLMRASMASKRFYQDLAVCPAMTIAENLFLGREILRSGILGQWLRIIDKKAMLSEATRHMQDLKIGIRSMNQAVETLSGGQRQGVAVARSTAFAKHVVILDEPTAALGVKRRQYGTGIDSSGARQRFAGNLD